MSRRRAAALGPLETEFDAHLKEQKRVPETVKQYRHCVRRLLRYIGDEPLNRVSAERMREWFEREFGKRTKQGQVQAGVAITQFLKFAAARLPVPLSARGAEMPLARAPGEKELALRRQWEIDRATDRKETRDDLIAQLARKVIDHYLYFQGRMKGEPENLDDVYRFADECRELIERNLPLFMGLSAGGRNIHSAIDERVGR
jgi:hypothetical protein